MRDSRVGLGYVLRVRIELIIRVWVSLDGEFGEMD